jgi:hypothetical protein
MNHAHLLVDVTSIRVRPSGPATGDIELVMGSTRFPGAGWNDFVIVVLDAWVTALLRLVRRQPDAERVHFMEGPYVVKMSRLDSGAIGLEAIERPGRVCALAIREPQVLVDNALGIVTDVLAFCRECRYVDVEVERLERSSEALSHEWRRIAN